MSYKISGIANENSRILVINQSDWSLETTNSGTLGNFEISGLAAGKKLVLARNSLGKISGFGGISPFDHSGLPFSHNFGSSLDTDIWETHFKDNANYSVSNDELMLSNVAGSLHSGGTVYTKQLFERPSKLKVSFKWKPHLNHHSSARAPGFLLINDELSWTGVGGNYGHPSNEVVQFYIHLMHTNNTTTITHFQLVAFPNATSYYLDINDITVIQWYNLEFIFDFTINRVTTKINSTTYNTDISSLSDIVSNFRFAFCTADYSKSNTAYFKDLLIESID